MKTIFSVLLATYLCVAFAEDENPLNLKVYTSAAEGFSVNSVLVSGNEEMILIDPQFLLSEAHRVSAEILESGKKLTTVYVTHPHPDHYFGLAVIREVFPDARFVALPEVVDGIAEGWMARYNFWKGNYGHNLPDTGPILPEKLTGKNLSLEGTPLEIIGPVEGDGPNNTFVWIPSLRAVVGGDILFSGAHFVVPGDHRAWDATLDQIQALQPEIVIPGHQIAGAPNDHTVLEFMREYMQLFDEAVAGSKSAEEVQQKVKQRYPGFGLELLLTVGSGMAFPAARPGP